ncbi:MAG: hypothetical protein U9Q22_00290 [Candidatus Altiarchaeota archaeon]|nr:hypothetical protein [Candidatus Altiarchaeota archaeon]
MTQVVSFKATEKQVRDMDAIVKAEDFTSRGELLRALLRRLESRRLSEEVKRDIDEGRRQEGRPLNELF